MTRVLVTGATGFVGGHLVRAALARRHAVTALTRPSARAAALRALGVEVVEGDLVTGRGVEEAVRDAVVVVHLAAAVRARSAAELWAVNRDGTARLVEALAARRVPPRLVHCSSLAAAGPGGRGPVSAYGASKRAAEDAIRAHAHRVPSVILRPGIVHGPGEPALLPALLPLVRLGLVPRPGRAGGRYSMIHVTDLCAALLAATERGATVRHDDPSTGVYPLSDGIAHHWPGICAAVAAALGRRPPAVLPIPLPVMTAIAALAELLGRARHTVPALNRDKVREMRHPDWTCTYDAAARDLGFTPSLTLADGLKAALAPEGSDLP
ncbi:NAD-dependent epimerase/dehydratase family protein [Nonomuraea sp. NPDC049421]|uniref:NAD-dependent epimerase/dehydratase family protein n=1 Tax=Nonomuraea sp. NPDC049421 TaxID=3155275 RepID=UPI00343A3A18